MRMYSMYMHMYMHMNTRAQERSAYDHTRD
jgi:hypothetical protein